MESVSLTNSASAGIFLKVRRLVHVNQNVVRRVNRAQVEKLGIFPW